jgi:hypothetical protein
MLADLLSRSKYITPSGASVDSYGRISRFGSVADAGTLVDQWSALSIPGVWRGVNLIANAIGGLPLQDYRNGVRIETPPILSRPNPPETRIETISAAIAACIIHGNFIALLGAPNATGYPDTIYPIAPERVNLKVENGRKIWQIDGQIFDQSEVMHVKGFSLPGHHVGVGLPDSNHPTSRGSRFDRSLETGKIPTDATRLPSGRGTPVMAPRPTASVTSKSRPTWFNEWDRASLASTSDRLNPPRSVGRRPRLHPILLVVPLLTVRNPKTKHP